MEHRTFLPPQISLDSASLNARITHKTERNPFSSAISIPQFAQERRYQEAARAAIETSTAGVTIYQPYMYSVEGKALGPDGEKPHHDIASRYASVKVGEREAWFEIIGQQDRSQIGKVDFITAEPLQIILGDVHSDEVQKLHMYTDDPNPDKALIRFVGIHEIPLYTGVERSQDAQEMQDAAVLLTKQLLTQTTSEPQIPTVEDIGEFIERQKKFEPLMTASNGVEIGQPQEMEVMLDNSHARLLLLYPTLSPDGKRATIITNRKLGESQEGRLDKSVIGRTDFYCGCEKHGERAQGHGCGRELLGALKEVISPEDAKPETDGTIIVAWGGVDDLGNGSVLHSLKSPNAEKLGLMYTPESQADTGKPSYLRRSREVFSRMPHIEHRDFDTMAAVLFAGAELAGATRINFYTGNETKKQAVINARDTIFVEGGRYIDINSDEHALRHVPTEVAERDAADRHPTRRAAYL